MSRSAPSTERRRARRRGFTLLEVMIASTIFAIVMIIALSQMSESTDLTRLAVAQADLRQNAQAALDRIARDLRSTQARYVGANAAQLQFRQFTPLDPKIDASGNPILTKDSGSLLVAYEYAQFAPATNDQLSYNFGSTLATANRITIAKELWTSGSGQNPPGLTPAAGFNVSVAAPATLPGLLTANLTFPDQPVAVKVQIVMQRKLGKRLAGDPNAGADWYVYAVEETQILLRPSSAY